MVNPEQTSAAALVDGQELIGFLGHASKNSVLDKYLTQNGLKKRPRGNSGFYQVTEGDVGITFQYHDWTCFEADYVHKAASQGEFILTDIDFTTIMKRKEKPFSGRLPFGLSFSMSRQEVLRHFSEPVDGLFGDSERGAIDIFVKGNVMVTVAFKPGEHLIDWLRVFMPTRLHQKRGVFPSS